ncbi:MAG TPA: hypothetical protein VK849_08065 [Longimicrobiales bacterium]|nr:hypothetical protein [Longimicrobiales bacterium]
MDQKSRTARGPGDIAYETFYGAALGGSIIALFFLIVDTVGGQPLLTPSTVGSVLFLGETLDTADTVRLDAVAYATIAHFLAFAVIGYVATWTVRAIERRGGSFLASAAALFVMLHGGFLVATSVLLPGLVARLGQGIVLLANVLAALAMTGFLRRAHAAPSLEPAEDIDDTADRATYPM